MRPTPWRTFWTVYPLLAVLPVLGLVLAYQWEARTFEQSVARRETLAVTAEANAVREDLNRVTVDTLVLTDQNELRHYLETGDPVWLDAMAEEYKALARHARVYDQVRYLDETGMEKVRVNLTPDGPVQVPADQLQDKRDRYYVREGLTLASGRIYVSPLDLNMERGNVEHPFKPMLRFITPVFDAAGRRRGLIVINYLAEVLLTRVETAGQGTRGRPMMMNSAGTFFIAADTRDLWGGLLPDRPARGLPDVCPTAWAAMQAAPRGQLRTPKGLFTFETVTPSFSGPSTGEGTNLSTAPLSWIVATQVPETLLARHEAAMATRNGATGFVLLVLLGVGTRAVLVVLDQRRRHRLHLEHLARTDALTGLANRLTFEERLDHEYERCERHDRRFAIVYIDLDGFKAINDNHGHVMGDHVLQDVAQALRGSCRAVDTPARHGGDEFVVLLTEIPSVETALRTAEKLRERISALRWGTLAVGASVGVAVYPDHATSLGALVRLADAAMYQSKLDGKNRVSVAHPGRGSEPDSPPPSAPLDFEYQGPGAAATPSAADSPEHP
ncbi:sensor domain-containing diguanylate cyclase [Pararhodospirillum oryzae]|uniref:diguanylate cyclase n=1 Tax=Pararhodospirillum oryzae TaxID=478448 RepID=A0A512H6X5_9PROT|nr:sensor domain-containing diguanylate cyclase [Pararhodospirillum oryzae]GEO81181.1 GGDEF domain-containing protein [Pararhodospirillum oryzae]